MPMHDWTRVAPNIYHHFHGRWLYAISAALNAGVLPPGYYALAEQVVRPFEPDVLTLHPRDPAPTVPPAGGATAVAARPPAAQTVDTLPSRRVRRRTHRRVSVRHVSTDRVVAIVELLSPGNKANRRDFRRLIDKVIDLLDEEVHLLIVDPFPPEARDPGGVHGGVARRLARRRYAPPADRPLTAVAYAAGPDVTAFVQPFAAGDPVPPMPLFLDPDWYVTVPLEDTYRAAWPEVPDRWRRVLEE